MKSFLTNLAIRTKLLLLVILFGMGFLGFGIYSFNTMNVVKGHGPIYTNIVQGKDIIADILPPPEYIIESYLVVLQMIDEKDKKALQTLINRTQQLQADYNQRHEFWETDLNEGEIKKILLQDSYIPACEFYQILNRDFIPAVLRGDQAKAKALALGELKQKYQDHRAQIDQVVLLTTRRNQTDEKKAKEFIASRTSGLVFIGFGILAGVTLLSFLFSHSITKPVKQVTIDLSGSSGNVQTAAAQLSSASQELSQGTSNLAVSIEEMNTSLEGLRTLIEDNSHILSEAKGLMVQSDEESKRLSDRVTTMQKAMREIQQQNQKTISIIKVINDIAFQTNLLSLNAAVEAARAGEAGKGFAVVASQVKLLATRSSEAAKETAELIESSIGSIRQGEEIGSKVLEDTSRTVKMSEQVSGFLNQISSVFTRQLKEANQVTTTIHEINKVVQQTASSSEETAAAGEELLAQAEVLTGAVTNLNHLVKGHKNHAA